MRYDDRHYDEDERREDDRRYDRDRYDRERYDRERDSRYGQNDRDWADDFEVRDGGRSRRPAPRRRRYDEESRYDDYDEDMNRDDYNDDDRRPSRDSRRSASFVKRHPVLMNFIYVIAASCLLFWFLLLFIDYWTFHGQERVVPDVKGQAYSSAAGNVDLAGLTPVLTDSVFDSYTRPGTVVEQVPVPGARIKKGGSVYLTIVAFSPKLVTVPDFMNVSVRQARSMFEGLGIKEVRTVEVISEYSGLVLGARFNGVALQPGARIPVSAVVTLEVGSGYEEDYGADVDTLVIDETIEELNID